MFFHIRILFFVFTSLFMTMGNVANASFPPSTGETACTGSWLSAQCTMWQDASRQTVDYSHTGPFACSFLVGRPGAYEATVTSAPFSWNGSSGNCATKVQGSNSTFDVGLNFIVVTPPPSCPSGSTLTNGSCTCNSGMIQTGSTCGAPTCDVGQTMVGGTCVDNDSTRCNDQKTIYNSTLGERFTDVEMPGAVSSGTSLCVPMAGILSQTGEPLKCTMNFEKDISFKDAAGSWVSRGRLDMGGMVGSYTVLPCGANQSATPQVKASDLHPPCPAGEQPGSVNGATVCKPYGPDVTANTTDKITSTTNADGSTTASTTTTECKGASCITTTSTTNGTGTSSTSSTSSKDSFCVANSGSAQCGGGAGGGDSGGCDAAADTVGCSRFGEPGATPPTPNENIQLTFSREAGFGPSNASCPAPRVLNIPGGRTISMSFDMYCTFAQGMRPFIIGFALLSAAGMVVFGATRKG